MRHAGKNDSFAFGKIILLGEHAVLYGSNALCGSINKGVFVKTTPGEGRLTIPMWNVTPRPSCPSHRPLQTIGF